MRVLLEFPQCGGDTIAATAAVVSLALMHQDLEIGVAGQHAEAVFAHNPHVRIGMDSPEVVVPMIPHSIHESNRPHHVMESFCRTLSRALRLEVPLLVDRPCVYVAEEERRRPGPVPGDWWLVSQPGAKSDYTVKRWPAAHVQRVLDLTPGVRWVQVGAAGHSHPPLIGAVDLRGRTTLRELVVLASSPQCRGVLTGESLLWHLAAAVLPRPKPAVCVAAGWLPRWWVDYASGAIVSRHGRLPCCRSACWMHRVRPLGDGEDHDRRLCGLPTVAAGEHVASCMSDIQPEEVAAVIDQFRRFGVA